MGNDAQFMILDILLRDKYTTMKKMAEEIGISVRSVERNIMELVIRGVPICTKKGRNGGVYVQDVYNAKTKFFSTEDIRIKSTEYKYRAKVSKRCTLLHLYVSKNC